LTLATGIRLGRYEIRSKLGEGGMGEVYRARDEKLNRDVAIKVLPAELSTNGDRLHRFEQEAQAAGTLNHPNILAVYDLGMYDSSPYIVSELLEGETLREVLDERSLGTRKPIDYAIQLAHGLAAAHDKGIIHRDLKPDNIFITKDGHVKILDFGLAKLTHAMTESRVPQTDIATRKVHTDPGTVMGTVGYMSPEQVRGQTIDHRSDMFSFGSILYEMLCGRRAFRRDTAAETMTAILKEEPPEFSQTNSTISPAVERIVRRCLEKQPAHRFQTASDLAFALEAWSTPSGAGVSAHLTSAPSFESGASRALASSRAKRDRLGWIAAGIFLLVSLALLLFTVTRLRQPNTEAGGVVRFEIPPPARTTMDLIRWPAIAISPDGSTVAFVGSSDGVNRLYVRRRDDTAVKVLPGTESASDPVFSPDGKWITFIADYTLKKVPIDGPVITLVKVGDARGTCWLNEDTLIYAPDPAGPLYQLSANGGSEPRQISKLDASKNERTHRWPQVLPGGKAVIFTVGTLDSPDSYERANIEAVILATGDRRVIVQGASMARYASTGHLIFARGGSLFAVGFDPDSLTTRGTPQSIVQGVAMDQTTGAVHFSIATDGTLTYVSGSGVANLRRVLWADRSGNLQPVNIPTGQYNDLAIAPDGSGFALIAGSSGSGDVWLYNFARATFTRFTFTARNASPIWSADSKSVFYSQVDATGNTTTIMRKPSDASREAEPVVSIKDTAYIKAIMAGGTSAIFDYQLNANSADILECALAQEATPTPIVATQSNSYASALSPDGHWLAYQSNDSGRPEIYVRDLLGAGGLQQVSAEGGEEPRWSHDGRELFFRNNDILMSAPVEVSPSFKSGTPRSLFNGIYNLRSASGVSYAVDPKGGRFLMIRTAEDTTAPAQVQVVVNWSNELRRLLPTK
jgi:eukaryotic-like serine/threonine-protein kinase